MVSQEAGDQVSVICEGQPLCPDVPGGHMPGTDLHLPCLWTWAAALFQGPTTYGLRGLRFHPGWWGRGVLDGMQRSEIHSFHSLYGAQLVGDRDVNTKSLRKCGSC